MLKENGNLVETNTSTIISPKGIKNVVFLKNNNNNNNNNTNHRHSHRHFQQQQQEQKQNINNYKTFVGSRSMMSSVVSSNSKESGIHSSSSSSTSTISSTSSTIKPQSDNRLNKNKIIKVSPPTVPTSRHDSPSRIVPLAEPETHFSTTSSNLTENKMNSNRNGTKPTKPLRSPLITKSLENENKKIINLDNSVGIINITNQIYKLSMKNGFQFNMMVVGESGLGKSTLVNSLFQTEIYGNYETSSSCTPPSIPQQTNDIGTREVHLQERGVHLLLRIIDTPGFGDALDNRMCWKPILEYIDHQYEEYYKSEMNISSVTDLNEMRDDKRIHSCIYFISPTGHRLKQIDIKFMKQLHQRVNIIPVIAKADTMLKEELNQFKKQILKDLIDNNIQIYDFSNEANGESYKYNETLKQKVPFAVVGSNRIITDENGKKFRGRQYQWGTINVENNEHCDFKAMREMLIRTHMQDLKETTHNIHYENYRYKKLAYLVLKSRGSSNDQSIELTEGMNESVKEKNLLNVLIDQEKEYEDKLERMRNEMEKVFETKVKEKLDGLDKLKNELEEVHLNREKELNRREHELQQKQSLYSAECDQFQSRNCKSINNSNEDIKHHHDTISNETKKKESRKIFPF
ncbi:hypothetical protein SNEBB_011057 [Seison nebaliae]|nr:hypothetical protein SNEBB_011057 [Seison nebaliae]